MSSTPVVMSEERVIPFEFSAVIIYALMLVIRRADIDGDVKSTAWRALDWLSKEIKK